MSIIPNPIIGAVASIIPKNHNTHTNLETLFIRAGAPGDPPAGNLEKKCVNWLKRCNDDPSIDAIKVLGVVIQEYMDKKPTPSLFGKGGIGSIADGQKKISDSLENHNFSYHTNGHIIHAGAALLTKTLKERFESGDFSSIEKEFERAVKNISKDPQAAITASSAIIESALKFYIEKFGLNMPNRMNIMDLWNVVRSNISLNSNVILAGDQKKMLAGLTAAMDGVGSFRSHIGSVHGRGKAPPTIEKAETRLAVNISYTIVLFIMEYL